MAVPLLQTKLYIPPVRSELVSRPRLIERLNTDLHHKLTLVSAPAGFGKTTLLSEWVQQRKQPATWLSLEPGDDDANRFWRYVIAALQTVDATIGETAQALLESSQHPPLDTLVTTLVNDITTLSSSLTLVLDDYHVIRTDSIHASLNFLLDHIPSQLHLVIATREDPPLALARRRGRRELTEIRAADLRFTAEEVGEFLNTMFCLNLSGQDIAALEDRTEGWAVGIQMAALSLQKQAPSDRHDFVATFAGDDRYIVDYLMEEVFQRQPPHVQTFLLQTSILERLCSSLCNSVTGRDDSQSILDDLEQANLFIVPLDNRRHWHRYHHLFADLLRQRLGQSKIMQDITSLYLQASRWCEREGFIAKAVSYALAMPDPEYAVALIERHVLDLFYRSETVLVYNWLKALSEELVRTRPLLCAVYANSIVINSFSQDDVELAERWLRDAEKALVAQPHNGHTLDIPDQTTRDEVAGFIATFRAYLARFRGDDPQTVIDLSLRALDCLPRDSLRFRSALAFNMGVAYYALDDANAAVHAFKKAKQIGEASDDLFNTFAAVCFQAEILRQRGQLHKAATICRETLRSINESTGPKEQPVPFVGTVYITLGRILLEWNDLEKASRALIKGLELTKLTAAVDFQMLGYVALARLKQAQGDVKGALNLLEQAEQVWPSAAAYVTAHRARLWLTQAEDDPRYLTTAIQWAEERQLELGSGDQYSTEQLALACLLIAQRRMREKPDLQPLFQFLSRQLTAAQDKDRTNWMIEVLILQALAIQVQGDIPQAIAALEHALDLAWPGGYVRTFVDQGPAMTKLLRHAASRGIAPEYATRLLVASGDMAKDEGRKSSLLEPLSKRELEVLQLIAEGLSNKQVAQKLFLSPNTVRIHASNIYGKLSVHNRTQAVACARNLGLL